MKRFGKFFFALVGFSVVMGFKFYNKSATAKEVKQTMMSICSTDSGCQSAVDTYFKQCFDSSFRLGSRRSSSSLDNQKLVSCINSNSGADYFASY